MNLKPEQLSAHLSQGLQAQYLIQGDEPLQHMECSDAVRKAAKQAGYLSREVYYVEKGFDWSDVLVATQSMSLFSELRLIELRLGNAKIGENGAKAMQQLLAEPIDDTIILILTDKPEKSVSNSKWYKTLSAQAVVVQVWPLPVSQLPSWLQQRAAKHGLQLDQDAALLLAQRSEGNLLAASQELEKIHLLSLSPSTSTQSAAKKRLSVDDVWRLVADNARYDIFALTDAALAGQAKRARRILLSLRADATEPVMILWSLCREIRNLLLMVAKLNHGMSLTQVLQQSGVWTQRKSLISNALQRLSQTQLEQLLLESYHADRVIKGMQSGQLWEDLLHLVMGLSGLRYVASQAGYPR